MAERGRKQLTVAAIGDLHVRQERTSVLPDLFAEMSKAADVVVLCGDLTDVGNPREAEVLAEDLHACSVPVIGVLGNHDYESGRVEEVRDILRAGGLRLLDGQSCEVDDVGFVGVKGFPGGFGRRMLSSFGEAAVKNFVAEAMNEAMRLENAMRTVKNQRALVILHYAPIQDTIEDEPVEIYPFLGCSRLAETIDRFKVSAVVHGHAHRGRYEGRTPGGAPVYNVAFSIAKPSGRPYALIEI
ncbi:MAG TPA: metallophosphoesterase [Xanthobacteraceae bacterium]